MDTPTLKLVLYGQHLGKVLSLLISAFFFYQKKVSPYVHCGTHCSDPQKLWKRNVLGTGTSFTETIVAVIVEKESSITTFKTTSEWTISRVRWLGPPINLFWQKFRGFATNGRQPRKKSTVLWTENSKKSLRVFVCLDIEHLVFFSSRWWIFRWSPKRSRALVWSFPKYRKPPPVYRPSSLPCDYYYGFFLLFHDKATAISSWHMTCARFRVGTDTRNKALARYLQRGTKPLCKCGTFVRRSLDPPSQLYGSPSNMVAGSKYQGREEEATAAGAEKERFINYSSNPNWKRES